MIERACQSVGIDLGTTYSSLAYVDAQMVPRVVSDGSGRAVMPSVVYFEDDEIIVGEMALEQAKLSADRVAQFIKVHMGDQWRQQFLGREQTPESISAMIIGQLLKEAEPQIGSIPSAVITVPAFFTEKRRRATQQAGEIAGLKVIGTLNEPMAATLAYGLHHTRDEQTVVVYDLGGGTFDVTIVRISPNELVELATNGNRQLGGKDWDQALIDHVAADFEKAHGVDPRTVPQAMQDLTLECEHAKRRLGRMAKTAVRVLAAGHDHRMEITRDEFDEMTAHLLQATRLTTETALDDAGLGWRDISRVVLVGGSTHMLSVRRMLEEISGRPPDTGVNPVLAVALGAATYAHMLETGHALKAIARRSAEPQQPDEGEETGDFELDLPPPALPMEAGSIPTVRFVTAHGVGVKVRSGDGLINKVLIPKNTQVPVNITKRFLTRCAGQAGSRIRIELTQGDTTDLEVAEHLGTGRIEGLPPGEPDGQPVDVQMRFDKQGRLHVSAVYVPTGLAMQLSLDIPGGLKETEVNAHRRYLESTGFLQPADPTKLIQDLERGVFGGDDDSDEFDEVFSAEQLLEDLGAAAGGRSPDGDDEDLPMIEPVD